MSAQPCRFFAQGNCRNQLSCPYSHVIPANPAKLGVCNFFFGKGCTKGDLCSYSHDPAYQPQQQRVAVAAAAPAVTSPPLHLDRPKMQRKFFPQVMSKVWRWHRAQPSGSKPKRLKPKVKKAPQKQPHQRSEAKPRKQGQNCQLHGKLPKAKLNNILQHKDNREVLPASVQYAQASLGKFSIKENVPGGRKSSMSYQLQAVQSFRHVLQKEPPTPERVMLPQEHTAVYHLPQVGFVSFDPAAMMEIQHGVRLRLRVLCDSDLRIKTGACLDLPFEPDASHYLVQSGTVVLFRAYNDVERLDRPYFRGVWVYRWAPKEARWIKGCYYESPNFHITTVSSTFDHVAIGRLPYDPDQLRIEREKKESVAELTQALAQQQQAFALQMQQLRLAAQQAQQEEQQRRWEEQQRRETERLRQEAAERTLREQRQREQSWYYRDPMDLLVWDKKASTYLRVLEYTKPVDALVINRHRELHVTSGDRTRVFQILLEPKDLHKFKWSKPVVVRKLTEEEAS